ncbi:MAG: helix-turn-helix transcriptional regulator [Acidobacteria bacterium]|nr:helix-turn-helix transcriptional regulator [Acidobacteriota bacterium]
MSDLEERVRVNMRNFRKRRKLSQKQFCDALGWGYHILPDLESGKTKWSLARIDQVSQHFEIPPDFFLMGEDIMQEHTGILRLLYRLEPEKRRSLRKILREWEVTDIRVIEEILKFARRFFQAGRRGTKKEN